MEITFWILLALIVYTFIGYGIILYIFVFLKRLFSKKKKYNPSYEPEVTLLVAAYNEKDFVKMKVENSLALDYPKDKLKLVWITDGSDDGTPALLEQYKQVKVFHKAERNGKIAAMNRGMQFVETPIVIFSDANTILNREAIREMVKHFENGGVACVAGEKQIIHDNKADASSAGEGFYWKYESKLKQWDAELYSAVGAAGELFAIRSHLFTEIEKDTILDDFIISLRLAMKGFIIQYSPKAKAMENASANVKEELKRKIRIAAGGIQSIIRLYPLLIPFPKPVLWFQYVSHRVLRWTITPYALIGLFLINAFILSQYTEIKLDIYFITMLGQIIFYLKAFVGYLLEQRKLRLKILFIPYYFCIMNWAVILGQIRHFKGKQSVNWERAQRKVLT